MRTLHTDRNHKHWEHRPEKNWPEFEFNQPYEKGLNRLKEDVLLNSNFDPATLWQWGTMQAMAVIGILKNCERLFGKEGQDAVFDSLYQVGFDIGKQTTAGCTIPADMSTSEWVSFYTSVINRIAYASLEDPAIASDQKVNFHIDWCPHQDTYQAFDCRVQRYFVQGMIDAGLEFASSQGRKEVWDVAFRSTIPSGSKTCFFEIFTGNPEKTRQWGEYTQILEVKAIENARKEDKV